MTYFPPFGSRPTVPVVPPHYHAGDASVQNCASDSYVSVADPAQDAHRAINRLHDELIRVRKTGQIDAAESAARLQQLQNTIDQLKQTELAFQDQCRANKQLMADVEDLRICNARQRETILQRGMALSVKRHESVQFTFGTGLNTLTFTLAPGAEITMPNLSEWAWATITSTASD